MNDQDQALLDQLLDYDLHCELLSESPPKRLLLGDERVKQSVLREHQLHQSRSPLMFDIHRVHISKEEAWLARALSPRQISHLRRHQALDEAIIAQLEAQMDQYRVYANTGERIRITAVTSDHQRHRFSAAALNILIGPECPIILPNPPRKPRNDQFKDPIWVHFEQQRPWKIVHIPR